MSLTKVIAKEDHRLGDSVMVTFSDQDGNDLLPGGRYYPATNDEGTGVDDKEGVIHIIATFADEFDKRPATVVAIPTKDAKPVEVKRADIDTKLAEIEAVKVAQAEADKARKESISESDQQS